MAGHDHEFTMRFLAGAPDRNIYGNVHGGSMMKWMDEAAYACAAGWCGLPCVTVSVSGIVFHRPVQVGHVVELRAACSHRPHQHGGCGQRAIRRPPARPVRTDHVEHDGVRGD